jgi:hypothetical protein
MNFVLLFRTVPTNEWDRNFVQQFTVREEKLFDIVTVYLFRFLMSE